ncbi:MAG TPA: YibE/F family protein [Patescibacteria group bacterium]|nr:YibE/F family protein [Patescibacteria group bacterium]
MKKLLAVFLFLIALFFNSTNIVRAEDEFFKAKVTAITNQGQIINDSGTFLYQEINLKALDGGLKDKTINISYGKDTNLTAAQLLNVGDIVVVDKTMGSNGSNIYQITDRYRLNSVVPILIFFFLIVIGLSQLKGVGSILGMFISLGVIIGYIVPQILKGQNPLMVSVVGCLFIMITTIYLAHGFSRKTTIAVISTFLTLVGTAILASLFVKMTFLTGLGNDDASSLRFGLTTANIDFRGLLLGGILIGTLGVLDDVTTGLSASIYELIKVNPKIKFTELFKSGLAIGKEHISSLVNTLVLAYAGASLPIFIIIILNPNHYPLWLILNDGLIIEEVVRTLAGSIGLVAAVPLTTLMAAFYFAKIRRPTLSE